MPSAWFASSQSALVVIRAYPVGHLLEACESSFIYSGTVGIFVGLSVGDEVGFIVGDEVGLFVGEEVGVLVGETVGDDVGDVLGELEGDVVGLSVGAVGGGVGIFVGETVGDDVGDVLGELEGEVVGLFVGEDVGVFVGIRRLVLRDAVCAMPMVDLYTGLIPIGTGRLQMHL